MHLYIYIYICVTLRLYSICKYVSIHECIHTSHYETMQLSLNQNDTSRFCELSNGICINIKKRKSVPILRCMQQILFISTMTIHCSLWFYIGQPKHHPKLCCSHVTQAFLNLFHVAPHQNISFSISWCISSLISVVMCTFIFSNTL
jgi:hypothetical protein